MATRAPTTNKNGKVGVRNRGADGESVGDWSVTSSMKEFWLWVVIVTLLLFIAMILSFGLAHNYKQVKKAEAILQRLEEKEMKEGKREKPNPNPDADGVRQLLPLPMSEPRQLHQT